VAYITVSMVHYEKAWQAFMAILIKFLPARTKPSLRAFVPEATQDLLLSSHDVLGLQDLGYIWCRSGSSDVAISSLGPICRNRNKNYYALYSHVNLFFSEKKTVTQ
jgi:hypothetical protein